MLRALLAQPHQLPPDAILLVQPGQIGRRDLLVQVEAMEDDRSLLQSEAGHLDQCLLGHQISLLFLCQPRLILDPEASRG